MFSSQLLMLVSLLTGSAASFTPPTHGRRAAAIARACSSHVRCCSEATITSEAATSSTGPGSFLSSVAQWAVRGSTSLFRPSKPRPLLSLRGNGATTYYVLREMTEPDDVLTHRILLHAQLERSKGGQRLRARCQKPKPQWSERSSFQLMEDGLFDL